MKWIIPFNSNKHDYDLEEALHDCGVDWNRNNYTYKSGDIVYIYECEPNQWIKYKCIITLDYKTVSTFDDTAYGGIPERIHFVKPQFETQLVYEFKRPVKLEELAKHGMSTKRITVMNEDGRCADLFRFIEEYEAKDRKREAIHMESDFDMDLHMPPGAEREAIAKERMNQEKFRKRLLLKFGHCSLCNVSNPELLIASHIKPWAASEPEERTDCNNGLLLCPNHDRLFDKGLITFNADGTIMISNELSQNDRVFMNIADTLTIEINDNMVKYMDYHRNNVFRD